MWLVLILSLLAAIGIAGTIFWMTVLRQIGKNFFHYDEEREEDDEDIKD